MTLLPAFVSAAPTPGAAPLSSQNATFPPIALDGFAALIGDVTAAEPLLAPGAAAIFVTKATARTALDGSAAISLAATPISVAAPPSPALPSSALTAPEANAVPEIIPEHAEVTATLPLQPEISAADETMAPSLTKDITKPQDKSETVKLAAPDSLPRSAPALSLPTMPVDAAPAADAMPVTPSTNPKANETPQHNAGRKPIAGTAPEETAIADIARPIPTPAPVMSIVPQPASAPALIATAAAKNLPTPASDETVKPGVASEPNLAAPQRGEMAPQRMDAPTFANDAAPGFADRIDAISGAAGTTRETQTVVRNAQLPEAISTRPHEIGRELGVAIARHQREGIDEISLRLDPGEMGKVHVRLHFEDGTLRAHVRTESYAALDLIRREAGDLNRALGDAGIRTDGSSFRFESGSQQQHPQQQARQQHGAAPAPLAFADQDFADEAPVHQTIRASGRVDVMA